MVANLCECVRARKHACVCASVQANYQNLQMNVSVAPQSGPSAASAVSVPGMDGGADRPR